jgi:hypothetical protein
VLPVDYRSQLEQLLYFNRLQARAAPAIADLVEKYGQPRIEQIDGRMRVGIGAVAGVQALFALAGHGTARKLAGVVIFTREGEDLVIIHLAVARTFSYRGAQRHALLVMRLVEAVREVARRVNGVCSVVLYYPAGAPQRLPIRRWTPAPGPSATQPVADVSSSRGAATAAAPSVLCGM